jgi:hypothetical protein
MVIKLAAPVSALALEFKKFFIHGLRCFGHWLQSKFSPAYSDYIRKIQVTAGQQTAVPTVQGRTALFTAGTTPITGTFLLLFFLNIHERKIAY